MRFPLVVSFYQAPLHLPLVGFVSAKHALHLPPLVLFCPCALLAILLKLLGFGGIVAGSRMMRLSAVIAINFAGGRLARSVSNRRKVDNFQHARTVVMGLAAFWLTEVGEEPIGPNGRASLNSLSSSR